MAIQNATLWLKKYSPFVVAELIGKKFGYSAGVVQGDFRIGSFAVIQL